ncbi:MULTISPECIES: hypothetical protein [unclassified Pseudomonas]|uniref:hypothetical protein n=1 Tax=unclassified Pseudomonas TaxID=196821 RepID=UPI001B31EAA8|nr:hypothetical protein [Pseudomonas sp. Tri1]
MSPSVACDKLPTFLNRQAGTPNGSGKPGKFNALYQGPSSAGGIFLADEQRGTRR